MFNLLVVEDEDMIRHKIINNTNWLSHGFQQVFEATVSEAVAKGTKVGNVTATDPEGLDVR